MSSQLIEISFAIDDMFNCLLIKKVELLQRHRRESRRINLSTLCFFSNCLEYGVLIGKPCKYGMYPIDPREEEWWLTSEGHVIADGDEIYDQDNYCMDIFYNKSESDHAFHLFICFDTPAPQEDSVWYSDNTYSSQFKIAQFTIIYLFSCVFLSFSKNAPCQCYL